MFAGSAFLVLQGATVAGYIKGVDWDRVEKDIVRVLDKDNDGARSGRVTQPTFPPLSSDGKAALAALCATLSTCAAFQWHFGMLTHDLDPKAARLRPLATSLVLPSPDQYRKGR